MGKCKSFDVECQYKRARNKVIAVGVVFIILGVGLFAPIFPGGKSLLSELGGGIGGPSGATGQSVNFKVSAQLYGGSYPSYGTISFFDSQGYNWGGGAFSTTTSGTLTTGVIATGFTYTMYFNGTSVWYPNSWTVSVPQVKDLLEPANYYLAIRTSDGKPFTIYAIATAYADQLIDVTTGGLSGAIRTNSGSAAMANDSAIVKNVPTTFTYTVSVTSTYAGRLPQYVNPAYPNSGGVQGFAYFIFNSTNMYLQSSTTGAVTVSLASNTLLIVPISMVISGAAGAQQSGSFTLVFPTAQHPTVYGGTVWNTCLDQLKNAKSTTFASLSAPTGYTVGSFQLLGNKDAGHTYCLWTVS